MTNSEIQQLITKYLLSNCDNRIIEHLGRNDLRDFCQVLGRMYIVRALENARNQSAADFDG